MRPAYTAGTEKVIRDNELVRQPIVSPFLPKLQRILTKIQKTFITSIQNKTKRFSIDNVEAEVIKNRSPYFKLVYQA